MATFKQYTASGGATESFSIKSFAKEEVYVRVDGALKTAGTGTGSGSSHDYELQSYTANGGTIAWVSGKVPASPAVVRIYRITDLDPAQATYSAGSSIKADDLNNNQEQVLRALREENDQKIQTWDIEAGAITTTEIKDATITNADISTTAEIAVSKLADGSSRQVLQTASNGSDVEWTSNVDIPGTLDVTSTAAFDSNVTVGGTSTLATVDINAGAIDGTTVGSSSASSGAFTTLSASGTTTAAAINASGAVGVDGNFDVNTNKFTVAAASGNTTVAGTLGVTGTTTAAAINASGAVGVDGNFDVATNKFTVAAATGNTVIAGNLDVTGQFDVTGTSNYTGQQTVPGGALVKDIRVGLDGNNEVSTSSGSLVLDSASGTVQVTDHFNTTGNADVDGNLNVDGTLTVDGVSTLTGAVTATGGVVGNVTGNVTGNTSGNAGTATALQNARTIGGVSFNGTANINLPGVNAAGNQNTSGNAATATDLAAAAKITNSEQGSHTANDTTYYTTSASDARYYNIGSLEEIQSGETWAADDAKIATTAAIDARIVDLVDDVGGFVPIANETSFPNANPDVNNGAGTLVSIKALASNLVSNGSGVATISNGTVGNSTVTINGLAASTTYPAGRGILIETSSTLNTYTFHRQLAEATATTTVANSIGNVNTCATNISNINAVAADATDIGVVAGKGTEIGRLGTADAVADMNTLATTAIVADLETCADNNANISTVGGGISNVNTVAGAISNVNTTAGAIANVNTTATNIANVNTVGGAIANVNTVGSNIGTVNDFAARYRGPQNNAGEYTGSLDIGDLYFNTTINALKVYTGSAWVAGVTQTGDYALKTGSTYTGNNTHNDGVKSRYGTGNDLEIFHNSPHSIIKNTNTSGYLELATDNFRLLDGAGSEWMIKAVKDGAVELYHNNVKRLETSSSGVDIIGELYLPDSTDLKIGNGGDLKIYHDGGTSSYIKTANSSNLLLESAVNAYIRTAGTENAIVANNNGSVELYYDTVKKFETISNGVRVTGYVDVNSGNITLDDNGALFIGAGDDLKLYHNGGNAIVRSQTGTLYLMSNSHIDLRTNVSGTEKQAIFCNINGSVELYYDNSKKFETQSTGIKVIGSDAGDQIKIVAEGTNAYGTIDFESPGSGGGWIKVQGEDAIKIIKDGSIELYHDNIKSLETTATGCTISKTASAQNAELLIKSTGGGQAKLQLEAGGNQGGGVSRATRIDFVNTEIGTTPIWTLINDYDQNGTNDFRLAHGAEVAWKAHDDGAVELYYDSVKKFETSSNGVNLYGNLVFDNPTNAGKDINWLPQYDFLRFEDNVKAVFGNAGAGAADLEIYHSGTNSVIDNNTGGLYIRNNVAADVGGDIFIQAKSGENSAIFTHDGSVALHYDNAKKLETTSAGVTVTGVCTATSFAGVGGSTSINFLDSVITSWGTGNDLRIYHSGDWNYIQNYNAKNLAIQVKDSENSIVALPDAEVQLYYDNSKKIATVSDGVEVWGDIHLQDSGDVTFGVGQDLKLRHDGTDSWIDNITGKLYIKSTDFVDIRGSTDETMIKGTVNGAVELYYDNSKMLSTESWGVKVHDNCLGINTSPGNTPAGRTAFIAIGDSDTGVAQNGDGQLELWANNQEIMNIDTGEVTCYRHTNPGTTNTYDLGSASYRWRNVYTYDLNLNNEGSQNDVDGTWGSWTIQEGQDDLFLLNRRNGKKYKFNLTEVS
jgi:hypothetical protein